MRTKALAATLLASLSLPSCMSTNLMAWGDTRLDSPSEEHMRQGVVTLFLIPAAAFDVVFFPFQLAAGMYPYGSELEPDPEDVRHGTSTRN